MRFGVGIYIRINHEERLAGDQSDYQDIHAVDYARYAFALAERTNKPFVKFDAAAALRERHGSNTLQCGCFVP